MIKTLTKTITFCAIDLERSLLFTLYGIKIEYDGNDAFLLDKQFLKAIYIQGWKKICPKFLRKKNNWHTEDEFFLTVLKIIETQKIFSLESPPKIFDLLTYPEYSLLLSQCFSKPEKDLADGFNLEWVNLQQILNKWGKDVILTNFVSDSLKTEKILNMVL